MATEKTSTGTTTPARIPPSVALAQSGGSAAANRRRDRRKKPRPALEQKVGQKEQAQAAVEMGRRLRLARELNGWELADASPRFGFATVAELSKIEGAKHRSAVPLWFIKRATQVYCVSADYLHGLTDELEMNSGLRLDRDLNSWLISELERLHMREIGVMLSLRDQIDAVSGCTRDVVLAVENMGDALRNFVNLNQKKFIDMRGGSTLVHRMDVAEGLACGAAAKLTKFRDMLGASALSKAEVKNRNQLGLDFMGAGTQAG